MFFVLFSLWIQHTFEQLIYLVGHKLDFLLFIQINTKFKKKKKRSCAGQHLSWCRTERLCSFPTGLELISSDSKGHHDQNKLKKKPTELEIWANDLFSPFHLHSDEKLTSNILWKFLITLSATSSQGIVGEKKKEYLRVNIVRNQGIA